MLVPRGDVPGPADFFRRRRTAIRVTLRAVVGGRKCDGHGAPVPDELGKAQVEVTAKVHRVAGSNVGLDQLALVDEAVAVVVRFVVLLVCHKLERILDGVASYQAVPS